MIIELLRTKLILIFHFTIITFSFLDANGNLFEHYTSPCVETSCHKNHRNKSGNSPSCAAGVKTDPDAV